MLVILRVNVVYFKRYLIAYLLALHELIQISVYFEII